MMRARETYRERSSRRLRADGRLLVAAAIGGAIGCSDPSDRSDVEQVGRVAQAWTPQIFGVDGNQTFQDRTPGHPWLDEIAYASEALNGFRYQLAETDFRRFSHISAAGRLPAWTEGTDGTNGGLDFVDLFFNVTHAGLDLRTPTTVGWGDVGSGHGGTVEHDASGR